MLQLYSKYGAVILGNIEPSLQYILGPRGLFGV